jgi:glycopeptide antibiotics resistance protein
VAYIVLLLSLTVLGRGPVVERTVNVDLLTTWASHLAGASYMRFELAVNALMLLPVGLLLPMVTGWGLGRSMVACLALAAGIEYAQLITARGFPEASDVVLNMLGALAGYGLRAAIHAVARRLGRLRC